MSVSTSMVVHFLVSIFLRQFCGFFWRAVFTKSIVTPVLGISGVGGAMAIYGAADVVVSKMKMSYLLRLTILYLDSV